MNQDIELIATLVIASCAALLTSATSGYIPGGEDMENKSAPLEKHVEQIQQTSDNLRLAKAVLAEIAKGKTNE
jgi:D-alanyl-D-alanine carboxypeptidase